MQKNLDCKNELWSAIGSSDGDRCFYYTCCRNRLRGGWCPSDDKHNLDYLADSAEFDIRNYDFIKPTPCKGKAIREGLRILAGEYLKAGGISRPPVPLSLASIFDKQNTIEVRYIPIEHYHGAIWCQKNRWIIQLRKDDTPEVQKFTLFHEIFHILAHNNTSPVFKKRGNTHGSFNELLADGFASFILMPTEWIMEMRPKINDFEQLAKIFDVPKSALHIRLKFMGLI